MKTHRSFFVVIIVLYLLSSVSYAEEIAVTIKGVDDGIRTSRQKDYQEALMNAKLQAIQRAGAEISAITKIVNFQIKYKAVESKAEGLLLPGFQVVDVGYLKDGTYQVVLVGKIRMGKDKPKYDPKALMRLTEIQRLKGEKSSTVEGAKRHFEAATSLCRRIREEYPSSEEALQIEKESLISELKNRLEMRIVHIKRQDRERKEKEEKLRKEKEERDARMRRIEQKRRLSEKYVLALRRGEISLRSQPQNFSDERDFQEVVNKFNFYHRRLNSEGTFANEFVDNGDGTITDHATGLMWVKDTGGHEWNSDYAEHYYLYHLNRSGRFGGYSDWRLPTIEELSSLIEEKADKSGCRIDSVFDIKNIKNSTFWTSDRRGSKHAWVVRFYWGDYWGNSDINANYSTNHSKCGVLAVRSVR